MANHTGLRECIYWGDNRLTGLRKTLYNVLTRWHNVGRFDGHVQGSPRFWGDICLQKVKYVRNFTFTNLNTLNACPLMPYHDPLRPFVRYWFSSTDGHDLPAFCRCISEVNQDRLEAEGGACIMYTHFGKQFCRDGQIAPEFRRLIERLSRKNGWFVPTSTLLDHLLERNRQHVLSDSERSTLEWCWLIQKIRVGHT